MNNDLIYRAVSSALKQVDPNRIDRSQFIPGPAPLQHTSEGYDATVRPSVEMEQTHPLGTYHSENSAYVSVTTNYTTGAHPSQPPTNQSGLKNSSFYDEDEVSTEEFQRRPRGRPRGSQNQENRVAAAKGSTAGPSKASIKRAEISASLGPRMIGANQGPKGETRLRPDGFLEWKEPETGKWLPAAPHNSFRQDFITADKSELPYLVQPESGLDPLDITSNCSLLEQNTWDFDNVEGWENIVDSDGNRVMFLNQPPIRSNDYPQPEYWHYKGLIMLDPDDHPVHNWTCIPKVFSSRLEGGRMEALERVFPWLRAADLRARMPRTVQIAPGMPGMLPKFSTYTQRAKRFRERMGSKAWSERVDQADRWKRRHSLIYAHDGSNDDRAEDGSMMPPRKRRKITSGPQDLPSLTFIKWRENQTAGTFGDPAPTMCGPAASTSLPWYEQSVEVDFRFATPQSPEDALNIKMALHVTRADFRSRHAIIAPLTPSGECYWDQYQRIQRKHVELWAIKGRINPPELIMIADWYGTFSTWPTPFLSQKDLRRVLIVSEMPQACISNGDSWMKKAAQGT